MTAVRTVGEVRADLTSAGEELGRWASLESTDQVVQCVFLLFQCPDAKASSGSIAAFVDDEHVTFMPPIEQGCGSTESTAASDSAPMSLVPPPAPPLN
jgi:hypothetical protein